MSSPSDRVLGTPPTNTSAPLERSSEPAHALEAGLAVQQRERETTLQDLARLRKEASAEIERLLAFLDQSDEYVMTERESDGDEDDASYPEGGSRLVSHPNEDDEDTGDDEPSLGSCTSGEHGTQATWGRSPSNDMEEEHDGAEPDGGDDEPSAGYDHGSGVDEPDLGWTVDGCVTGGVGQGRYGVENDLEAGEEARAPQDRTCLGSGVRVDGDGWRQRLTGLTDAQHQRFEQARRDTVR